MNTSMLFAELIIIGLEGGIWLLLLVLTVFGVQNVGRWLLTLQDWQLILIAVFTPLLYVIGIILDRVSDQLLHRWGVRLQTNAFGSLALPIGLMRFSLNSANEPLNQQIEYTRSRMRIVRASTINFALVTVFGVAFMYSLAPNPFWLYVGFVAALGALMTAGAFYSWRSLVIAHAKIVKTNYDMLQSREVANRISTVTT